MATKTVTELPAELPPSYPADERPLSARSSSSLPAYTDEPPIPTQLGDGIYPNFTVPTPFTPTQRLRIDTQGHAAIALPCAPKPDPIPVYDVTGYEDPEPLYVSLRNRRHSGTCRLMRGQEAVCTTTYRFGPGRPPVITLHGDEHPALKDDATSDDEVLIEGVGAFTRAQILRSRQGTFRWRYASSKERKAQDQDSVLILEKIANISSSSSSSKTEIATEIGRFVRGAGTRTPGTTKHTAGNGGLLLVDLSEWTGEKRGEEDEEEVRALVVASCVAMLKKEVDRRRGVQTAVAVSVLGGGGGG